MGPVGIALASVFVLGLVAAGIAITGIFGQNDHASRNAREAPTNTGVAVASKSARSVEQAIERHWAAIAKGRLDAAYDDLSPRLKADPKTGSRSVWIANQRTDRLRSESVRAVAHDVRKGRARADIALRTRAVKSGCREWSGGYGLVWRGGRWLIDEANIVPRPC
jgi:hypothetical protein